MTSIDTPPKSQFLDRNLKRYGNIDKRFAWDWFVRDLAEREAANIRAIIAAAGIEGAVPPCPTDLVINHIPAQVLNFLWRNDCHDEAAKFAADIWVRVRGQSRWPTAVWIDVLGFTIEPDGWSSEHRHELFARVRKIAGR